MSRNSFPPPQPGVSLILAFRFQKPTYTTLIIGTGTQAASRAFSALEAGSHVIVLGRGDLEADSAASEELRWRVEQGQVAYVNWYSLLPVSVSSHSPSTPWNEDQEIEGLDSLIKGLREKQGKVIKLVCVTDTLSSLSHDLRLRRTRSSATKIYDLFAGRNIPVNTTDMPDLCDFTFTSTHRFVSSSTNNNEGEGLRHGLSHLQVGVTTNGHGCRLAGRIKREIVAKLPKEIGRAVEMVGRMRALAKEAASQSTTSKSETGMQDGEKARAGTEREEVEVDDEGDDEFNEDAGVLTPNRPVPSRSSSDYQSETDTERARRRVRWVAQVSEYWPFSKLANLSEAEMNDILSSSATQAISSTPDSIPISLHSLALQTLPTLKPGRILLVGSGPGHASLLTLATHTALSQQADLVLSDKLVPDSVLNVIPKHVRIKIARKFPGNADGAQIEMMHEAVEAAKKGLCVVRLKQGDPAVYARSGEEVLYFRSQGFEPLVIPGVSSALAGPLLAGIPITQRGVAESFIVCTGVGRGGKGVKLPGYVRSRTLVILMGVARLKEVVDALISPIPDPPLTSAERSKGRRDGAEYPGHTPIAIVERASMPDQRVVSSTLDNIVKAMESVGEQRPPGMIVVGWAVLALWGAGDVTVLDEGGDDNKSGFEGKEIYEKDERRVRNWLGGSADAHLWKVKEGLDDGWEAIS